MLNELLCFLIQLKEVSFLDQNHCSACYDTKKYKGINISMCMQAKIMHTHSVALTLTPRMHSLCHAYTL
jgi:hypothetical protein